MFKFAPALLVTLSICFSVNVNAQPSKQLSSRELLEAIKAKEADIHDLKVFKKFLEKELSILPPGIAASNKLEDQLNDTQNDIETLEKELKELKS